jgi:hypothetical protein
MGQDYFHVQESVVSRATVSEGGRLEQEGKGLDGPSWGSFGDGLPSGTAVVLI